MRWLVVICFRIKSSYRSGVLNSKKLLAIRMLSDRILYGWLRPQYTRNVRFWFYFLFLFIKDLKLTNFLSLIYWISACRRSEGQLRAPRFLLQVLGASTSYVDYECRLDWTTYLRLSSRFLAPPSSWYRKLGLFLSCMVKFDWWISFVELLGQGPSSNLPHW